MSHTLGPWIYDDTGKYYPQNVIRMNGVIVCIIPQTATMKLSERDANVHLIAAAPRLLASLQELSEWMRDHTGPADGTLEMLTRAVETIKEAGGEIR